MRVLTQTLKPSVLGCQYVRAKARTLQKRVFRSLFSAWGLSNALTVTRDGMRVYHQNDCVLQRRMVPLCLRVWLMEGHDR